MKVFITGIRGFIGSHLATALRARGHELRGSSSGPTDSATVGIVPLPLGDSVDPSSFEGAGAVVHTAWDLTPGAGRRNVEGTKIAAEAARAAGVTYQLFLSSYSAHQGAVTEYGRTKFEIEAFFHGIGHAIVRPGLVIGPGGLHARLAEAVARHRIVPVVCPSALVPVVSIRDLLEALTGLVEQRVSGLQRLHLDERARMMDLVAGIRRSVGSRALLLPLPYLLALPAVSLLVGLGLRAPINADSIRALQANQADSRPGDLRRLVARPQTLPEMLDALR